MPHLTGLAFPSTGHPAPIRALTIPGSLAATPASCSLISGVVFESGVRPFKANIWRRSICLQ